MYNEELLGEVVSAIAIADFKYDETKGSRENYRYLYAKYYIAGYFKLKKRHSRVFLASALHDVEDKFKDHDSKEMLEFTLAKKCLSQRERRIVYLRFWEDLTFKEIAQKENISSQYAEILLKKAIGKLHDTMANKFL